ncbi:MAG: fused MFS/spermidine synthase [Deltaproteobacteria bacterium]|jgi:spermidine synthase|nr:fused MFS/spermidine synthase [Deltaproteobacteria bacterium]
MTDNLPQDLFKLALEKIWGADRQREQKIIFEADSSFHHITVADNGDFRTMYFGSEARESETSVLLSNLEAPVFEYPGLMFLSLALGPLNSSVLMLGLGGGFIPMLFKKYLPKHQLTVVEVDPMVVEVAERFFGFSPGQNVELVVEDGYKFIADCRPGAYDQIWLDAFGGYYIPKHLATVEFLELICLKLPPKGLLAQNLHQTAHSQYEKQLRRTYGCFGRPPLVFSGVRSANSVVISINDLEAPLAKDFRGVLEAVKAFQTQVGPYDLTQEANKLKKPQPFASPFHK